MAHELLRSVHVEDDARVRLRRGHERDPTGDVRLDETGNDIHRGSLRRDDEMDADGPGHLRDPADRVFDVARRHHHQVGELVDYDDDERHVFVSLVLPRRDPQAPLP